MLSGNTGPPGMASPCTSGFMQYDPSAIHEEKPADLRASVLVVADRPANLLALRTLLGEMGLDLVEAPSTAAALRLLLDRDFAAILLDLEREGDGLETARHLRERERPRRTPLLFLAAPADNRMMEERAYSLGAVDYLVKPLVPLILRAKVAGFVELFHKAEQATRAELALRGSEQRFRQLAENINEVFWMSDPLKAQVLYVSPTYEQVWGRSCLSLYERPRSFLDAIHPDDRARVAEQSLARQARGEAADVEYRVVRPDASVRWVRDRSFPIKDPSGCVYRIVGIAEDVTDRRRAEDALRENEERLRTLSNNLPRGAIYQIVQGEDGQPHFTYISAGVERLFGVTPAEVRADATALYGLIHEEDFPRVRDAELAGLRALAPFDCEFRHRTRSGEILWVHCRSAPRRVPGGGIAWDGVLLDVTERKRAEEALREADRKKDEFLAMLAHELRNPLAPIRNAVEVLRLLGPDTPDLKQSREIIERQVEHLARLVDDLLDVSRITSGRINLHKERVDLAAVLARAVEASRPLLEARKHTLTVALPPQPVWVKGDATRLAQVVSNLLNNAAKYTENDGRVWLTVEQARAEAVVTVRDTGIGIPGDLLPHVFDLFTQGDRSLARSEGGLGIGLTLVKRLVEMHGGTATAASAGPGKGSAFAVRLPVLETGTVPPPAEAETPSRDRSGAARRVLVVDDSADAARSLALLLAAQGHAVRTAHDGLAALEAARAFQPEVVLLDIGLPRMDGYEVARRLRGQAGFERTLLVALTGYGQEEDRRRTREAGFDAHLVKPADLTILQRLLATSER